MSANERGIIAVTGRAHCQRQVAFFPQCVTKIKNKNLLVTQPFLPVQFSSAPML